MTHPHHQTNQEATALLLALLLLLLCRHLRLQEAAPLVLVVQPLNSLPCRRRCCL
jgi:hypothetical protein